MQPKTAFESSSPHSARCRPATRSPALRDAPDFHRSAALADALLHPHDRAYSVAQLFEFLEAGGLTFGRWVRQAPYSPRCGLIGRVAATTQIAQLAPAEQFAAVELLRGTMARHSLIAHRDDSADRAQSVTFDGDAYLDYVPIRASDTISVQERLPAGTAAVLINRKHAYTDISLALGAEEKRWFDAIDARRTIGEIAPVEGRRATRRAFFERLWWYDQVVFDAISRSTPPRGTSYPTSLFPPTSASIHAARCAPR